MKIKTRERVCLFCLMLLLVILPTGIKAEIPNLIDFQGSLTDTDGNPVSGDVEIIFSLYAVPAAGAVLWQETKTITVTDGIYATSLGSTVTLPDTVWDSTQLWLGIKVGSDAEMSPRIRIVAVPYALRAKTAENVSGGTVGGLPVGAMVLSYNENDAALLDAGFVPAGRLALQSQDCWSEIAQDGRPAFGAGMEFRAVAMGNTVVAMGKSSDMIENLGGIYDPATDSWSAMAMTGMPTLDSAMGIFLTAVNDRVILMGESNATWTFTGATYVAGAWDTINLTGAPAFGSASTYGVVNDGKVVVMGKDEMMTQNLGGIYDPVADSWTAMNMTGLPNFDSTMGRSVVSANGKVVIMGRDMTSMTFIGAIYDSAAESWAAISTTGAPAFGSEIKPAVVIDNKVVVMGRDDTAINTVGGIYDPATNSWTTLSMSGLPDDLEYFSMRVVAVNGKVAVIGRDSMMLGAGALYDVSSGAWSTISQANFPSFGTMNVQILAIGNKVLCLDPEQDPATMQPRFFQYDTSKDLGFYYLYLKQ